MRTLRSAFVVTVAATVAACASQPTPQPEEPHRNPPAQPTPQPVAPVDMQQPPGNPPAPACPPREAITAGTACSPEGMRCYAPTAGCQPPGYHCEEGVWRVLPMPTCNPPPLRR